MSYLRRSRGRQRTDLLAAGFWCLTGIVIGFFIGSLAERWLPMMDGKVDASIAWHQRQIIDTVVYDLQRCVYALEVSYDDLERSTVRINALVEEAKAPGCRH